MQAGMYATVQACLRLARGWCCAPWTDELKVELACLYTVEEIQCAANFDFDINYGSV